MTRTPTARRRDDDDDMICDQRNVATSELTETGKENAEMSTLAMKYIVIDGSSWRRDGTR